MKPSEQNKADRELLATAIERLTDDPGEGERFSSTADETTADVFEEWLIKLEAPPKREVLSDKQRAWARKIAGVGGETYENLYSAGKVPRGREVPTPAVLRRENLPMRPPGRK
jgi:hypothetical protein